MSSSACNWIFSNVVATLSDTFLNQLTGNKRDVLHDTLQTENVTLLFNQETASAIYSLSGLLEDVLLCQKKLAQLVQGEGEVDPIDEYIKEKFTIAKTKQNLQGNIKPYRKRRKVHEHHDEINNVVELKREPGIREITTKRGRVVKRPSIFSNAFVQLDRNSSGEKENVLESGQSVLTNQVDEDGIVNEIENDGSGNDSDIKMKNIKGEANSEVIGKDQVDEKPARKVVKLSGLKVEPADKEFKEIKKKIRQHYENKMPYRYFCGQCSFKSKRESHYKNHLKLHEKNPDLKLIRCSMCDFTCIRQSLLKKHQICHENDSLTCGICNFKTSSMKHLDQHMQSKHLSSENDSSKIQRSDLKCSLCEFTAGNKTALLRHIKIHFKDDKMEADPLFSCHLCSYSTRKQVLFERHKKHVHSNIRPFLCDLCGAAFKRTDTLAAHKTTHLDISRRVLPFKCTKCHKAFKSRAHLRSHMYVHSNVKAFQCHICGQLFKTKQVQQKHIQNIHSNPRSFKCGTCLKDFNTKYTLQRHEKTHENDLITEFKSELSIYEQPGLKCGTGEKILKDRLKLEQGEKIYNNDQAIVLEFNRSFNEDAEASNALNEGQDNENIIGKEGLVQQVETLDENMSAIQHIALNEIGQHLDNGADQFQTSNDIGTIYIEGLDTVMSESGAINIVNLDGQNIQQILIPRSGMGQSSVNVGQFISQINPASVTQEVVLKGVNSDELTEEFVSTESLEKGVNSGGLSEVYVSTIDIKDANPAYVNAVDIGKVYIETEEENFGEVKQFVVPSNLVTNAIGGEIVVVQDKVGENHTS